MQVSGQLHAQSALSPGKSHWYPSDRRLDGPKTQVGRDGEKKRESNPGRPDRSIVSVLTELSRLLQRTYILKIVHIIFIPTVYGFGGCL
jgi:hypothetical protein